MSNTTLRVSLNGADMPFLYRDASRAVVLPGADPIRYYGRPQGSADWNIPQLLYCENVMPISKGLLSTQFQELIPASGNTDFDQAITLRDKHENNTLLTPAKGKNYLLDISTGTWASSLAFTATYKLVTRGYTQGRSFIMYEKEKLFEYDGVTGALVDRTGSLVLPTGFVLADIRGIGAASNYLLLFTEIDVLWSSPTDPLNFDRSLNNGSGYQTPEDARGQISCILPVAGGAIIYTLRNAVAVVFTNNAALPFVFRGITNSGGVASYEQIAYDADEQYQYVWGSGGLQQVSLQAAQSVFPEVSDFLTAGRYETYNYTTHAVDETELGTYFAVKLTYVAQRFLVISYGPTPGTFTYALIYDTALSRWGKIKLDHVDCFTYPYPNIMGDLAYSELFVDYTGLGEGTYAELGIGVITIAPPKKGIAFLATTGAITILVMDYSVRSQKGAIVLGQIQHVRDRLTTLQEVELEGVDDVQLFALVSMNGKTLDRSVEFLAIATDDEYRQYAGRETGKNINLALEGSFQLTGLLVTVAKNGRN